MNRRGFLGMVGTVLAEMHLPDDWHGAAEGGRLSMPFRGEARASGVPESFQIERDGRWLVRGSVGAPGGGANLTLSNGDLHRGQQLDTPLPLSIGLGAEGVRYSTAQRNAVLDAVYGLLRP